jgi:hypothetical protein
VNSIGKPPGLFGGSKPQDAIAKDMRTQEALDQTQELYTALGRDENALQAFSQKVGTSQQKTPSNSEQQAINKMVVAHTKGKAHDQSITTKANIRRREEQIKDDLDLLVKQQAKLDKLTQKPSFGDKFKAFFNGGGDVAKGLQKAQGKLTNGINDTTNRLVDAVNQSNGDINLKDLVEKQKLRIDQLKQVSDNLLDGGGMDYVLARDIDRTVPGVKNKVDMPQEKALYKAYQKNEGKVDKLEKRVGAIESVRDAIAQRNPGQQQGVEITQDQIHNTLPSNTVPQPRAPQQVGGNNDNLLLPEDQIPDSLKEVGGFTMKKQDGDLLMNEEDIPESLKQEGGLTLKKPKVGEQTHLNVGHNAPTEKPKISQGGHSI